MKTGVLRRRDAVAMTTELNDDGRVVKVCVCVDILYTPPWILLSHLGFPSSRSSSSRQPGLDLAAPPPPRGPTPAPEHFLSGSTGHLTAELEERERSGPEAGLT